VGDALGTGVADRPARPRGVEEIDAARAIQGEGGGLAGEQMPAREARGARDEQTRAQLASTASSSEPRPFEESVTS